MEENIQVLENKKNINSDSLINSDVSSLFNQQETRKKFNIIGIALIAFIGVGCVLFSLLLTWWPEFSDVFNSLNFDLTLILKYSLIYGIGFVLFYFVIKKIPKESIKKEKFRFGRLIAIFTMVYPLSAAGGLVGGIIESIISPGNTTIERFNSFFASDSVFSFIIPIIVAPIVEELVFRKMLIDRTKRYGEKTAILFSALCFGLFHMDIPQFLYATCIGCIFGYVYSRSGKIHYTMIMHAVVNSISLLIRKSLQKVMEVLNTIDYSNPENLTPMDGVAVIALFFLLVLVFVLFILGIIFLCTRSKRARFVETSPYCIPKGQKFKTIASSWGVLLFAGICIAMIVVRLLI